MSSSIRMSIVATLGGALLATTGCMSNTQKPDGHVRMVNGEKVVCRREAPTGSHISQMVCYKMKHVEDRRESDKEKIRTLQIGGAINTQPQQ